MRSIFTGAAGSYRIALLTGAAAFSATTPGMALAQDAAEPELEAPENVSSNNIIVTASKREQTLQETPISVSVTSGETLENAQIRDVLDLQSVAPSLRVSQLQTSSASTFIIRGFGNGDNNFGIEPSVGVFIDGVFRSRSAAALGDLPNVQRIEVLNGPQSTLFGKNASAGVISVVTREPQFEFGGKVEASYGNFDAIIVKGDVTGPIGENLAFSLDAGINKRDGYARIVNLGVDQNDRDRWNVGGQLLFEPSPDFKIRAKLDYSDIDEVCCQVTTLVAGPTVPAINALGGQLDTDLFSYNAFLNSVPRNTVENYGGSLHMDWNTGPFSVTSITSYRELENFFRSDIDYTSLDIADQTQLQNVETFTQEIRIASDFDGPFNFLLGGFYFDESITQESAIENGDSIRDVFELLAGGDPVDILTGAPSVFNGVEALLGLPQESIFSTPLLTSETFSMDNTSWSIFGTFDFEPFDGLVLTAGFNYTDDSKDFALAQQSFDTLGAVNLVDAFLVGALAPLGIDATDPVQFADFQANNPAAPLVIAAALGNPDGLDLSPVPGLAPNGLLALSGFQFQPPFLAIPNAVEDGRTRDDELTYLLRAAYEVSPSINIYASYATGFKASSVNLSRDSRPTNEDFNAGPGPRGSNILAPSSPIRDAGLALPNLVTGSRFAGPEEAEVYEVGIKGAWDGLSVNLALFDQTIEGFQSFAFTGTGFALRNAGQQSVRGFEVDVQVQPTDGLVLTFAATHLDPIFDDFPGSVLGDLTGERPGGIPAWAIATSATYTHEFGATGNSLITRLDYNHESNTDINNGLPEFNTNLGNTDIFRREVNLVNGSMTFAMDNGVEIGLWGRNLLNDQFISTVFDGVAQAGTVSGYPSAPRTYGGIVRFKF